MSDNKPGGAKQSTSNDGGGEDPDPGGGRDDYSPVKNGLQLRLKDQEEPLESFTYAWALASRVKQSLNWELVTTEDIQCNHIRCHTLKEGDDLPVLVTSLDTNSYAQALILINVENNYQIDFKFLSAETQWNIPILLTTTDDGKVLTELLKQHKLKVEAKVILKSGEPVQPQPVPIDSTAEPATLQPVPAEACHSTINAMAQSEKEKEKEDEKGDAFQTAETRVSKQSASEEADDPVHGTKAETHHTGTTAPTNPGENQESEATRRSETEPEEKQGHAIQTNTTQNGSSRSHPLVPPNPILNGLHVKIKDQDQERHYYYTYAWAPFTENPEPIDWIDITNREVTYHHIRCHQMSTHGEDLPFLISTLESGGLAVALILINTERNYQIDHSFVSQEWNVNFPILILKSETGPFLEQLLRQHDRNIEAKIYLTPPTDLEAGTANMIPSNDRGGPGKMIQAISDLSSGNSAQRGSNQGNMATRIEELLFVAGEHRFATEDSTLFTMVMSELFQFEEEVSSGYSRRSVVNALLKILQSKYQQNFETMFPLFMALAHRMRDIKPSHYKCESLQDFVKTCITGFESLDVVHVAKALKGLFDRGDFKVGMKSKHSTTISAFELIENAFCSFLNHKTPNLIYPTMLLVTTCLSFCAQRKVEAAGMWHEHFLKDSHKYPLHDKNIEGLKRGIDLGQTLNLPPKLTFGTKHLGQLLSPKSDSKVRFFYQQRNVLTVLQRSFTDEEFMQHIAGKLKDHYNDWLKKRPRGWINALSSDGSRLGAVKDGLVFVDTLLQIVSTNNWNLEEYNTLFQQWLILLLSLIDFDQDPRACLQEMLSSELPVARRYQKFLVARVIEETRKKFHGLTVHKFCPLYIDIWPTQLLEEYLNGYIFFPMTKICEPIWKEFFTIITKRFTSAAQQELLHTFLMRVAAYYRQNQKADSFIVDLLQLEIPNLFSVRFDHSGHEVQEDTLAVAKFENDLRNFIRQNKLKYSLLSQTKQIMSHISAKKILFQEVVLAAAYKEMIPEADNLIETSVKPSVNNAMDAAVNVLTDNLVWIQKAPTLKQKFCLQILCMCCTKIPVSSDMDFNWTREYTGIINKLGTVFCSYSSSKKFTEEQTLCKLLPEEVRNNPSDSVLQYFQWIQRLHKVLSSWSLKLDHESANYDDIFWYHQNQRHICKLAEAVAGTSLVLSSHKISGLHLSFQEEFVQLNQLLLKYIPGDPKAGWCSMIDILTKYKADIPQGLQEVLSQCILFPNEVRERSAGFEVLVNQPSPFNAGCFQPPNQEIHLRLSKSLSLSVLHSLVHDLSTLLAPIHEYVDFMVYFELHPSKLFNAYLLQIMCELSGVRPFVSVTLLKIGVEHTKSLLIKVLRGNASFGEIIAKGTLNFENFNIDEELNDLVECKYIGVFGRGGLAAIKSLLKLFQFIVYIPIIEQVLQQYKLEDCLDDPKLKNVTELAKELQNQEAQERLTPANAESKWKRVCDTLCIKEDASPKCLELFSKVADSADFSNFLKEKQFTGPKGEDRFNQEFQLITAQLQHDEYREMVLNHLFAAFRFIAPFMDPNHSSLHSLMTAVTALDLPEGLPQLETVKNNMHLIRFWFSQTEENVWNQLDDILNNGYYQIKPFLVAERSYLQLVLEYEMANTILFRRVGIDELEEEQQTEACMKETLYRDQIDDFVHKLGFLDTRKGEKEEGQSDSRQEDKIIQHFLHLNGIAFRLLDLFGKLRELCHPDYSTKDFAHTLLCSTSLPDADGEVIEVEETLREWMNKLEEVHSSYKWLLFFRVPKLMMLYEALAAEKPSVPAIIKEVGFLFKRDPDTRESLGTAITSAMESCASKLSLTTSTSPMDVAGSFLKELFNQEHMHNCTLPTCYERDLDSNFVHYISSKPVNILHSAFCYSQTQLIRLILGIYGGPPGTFEVLHCKPSTTEQELKLFMERVAQHPQQYLVLEVNHLPYQLQEVLLQLFLQLKNEIPGNTNTCIHFIETSPSVLREVPWLKVMDYKEDGPPTTIVQAETICQQTRLKGNEDFSCIELVYSLPGNGKTHYINEKLKMTTNQVTIAVNEAFSTISAIEKLCTLPQNAKNCAVFFNFTILPPVESAHEKEKEHYQQLIKEVGWFFFDLLFLCFVEDPATGMSFQFPGGLSWAVYVEVPSRAMIGRSPEQFFFIHFKEEIPALGLLGTPKYIDPDCHYTIDKDVQLVCKYLRANDSGVIDTLYNDFRGQVIKFSLDPDLTDEECKALLQKHMPVDIKQSKITQKLFIQYMKRRCMFLDNLPAFNYNSGVGEYFVVNGNRERTDTHQLGSTLMQTMLKEVVDFCDPTIKENWSQKAHQQLIYDFKDGGGSLGLISLLPDQLPREDRDKFIEIGVETPTMEELYSKTVLHKYLSRSLNIPLKNDHLTPIQESHYVLTLDYTLKMLNIHERYECGIPVIIEGETGVGKTALIEMLSQLWNYSWFAQWERRKDRIVESMKKRLGDLPTDSIADHKHAICVDTVYNLSSGKKITEEMLDEIVQIPDKSGHGQFYTVLNESLRKLKGDPIFSMLSVNLCDGESLADAFCAIENDSFEGTAHLLYIIFSATVKTAFHKLNVHAALQPKEIEVFFEKVFEQAFTLQRFYNSCDPTKRPNFRVPFVTAYLDEINTASCLGLFKEIIVDRTIDGKPIPQNVFIIASCNPHRGDILAAIKDRESWLKGTYYVRKLHPTLQFLMWDYGSLNEQQEREYVNAKMEMLTQQSSKGVTDDTEAEAISPEDIASLTDLILESQKKMREYAFEQLKELSGINIPVSAARACAKSSVSQRDIQRVFTFYKWLMKMYSKFNHHHEPTEFYHRRAVMVSLGIVYFMRLNSKYRAKYRLFLDNFDRLDDEINFSQAFKNELGWYIDNVELPPSIAKTEALKENVFAIIACTMTHTPLIIVGDPGSSKTLSFNIVIANFKGSQSRIETFRHTDFFKSLDAHFYQCSRRTTSNEVEKTFKRAITRQRSLHNIPLPVFCVVFMDEAGLPEDKLESLKILHYHLDRQEVSFVAISNHVLDAAKTNRAVSLFRPKATDKELYKLAKGSILPPGQNEPSEYQEKLLNKFCSSYNRILEHQEFQKLFGLRDFIHFVTYLRRKHRKCLDAQLMLEGLERNFNGSKKFNELCQIVFNEIDVPVKKLHFNSILSILKNSLADHVSTEGDDIHNSIQSEVRYKLIIDPSEDDSLVRLLFTNGVLKRDNTWLYICSDFPGDRQLRVHTIAQIRHSVAAGHTILMCQTDEIHESFYDLFNQRFCSIEDPQSGTRHYTNIAIGAHSRPCRVNPHFQCVVVIKESELKDTPAPFLNRFEKYYLTHRTLLDNVFENMPPCLKILLQLAYSKVSDFILCVNSKQSSFYGFSEDSLESLMLTVLPPVGQEYKSLLSRNGISVNTDTKDVHVSLLGTLMSMLQKNAGFHIPEYSAEELKVNADHIFKMIQEEPEFEGIMPEVNQENVSALIDEALHILHHGPEPNNTERPFEIYTDALMVIAVLTQWIVNYLCKQLMQLMTPEALAVHCEKIPTVYLENYLKFQEHFSLKELVERQFDQLKVNKWDNTVSPTKLLCFTRSSPLIHQLPSEYPSTLTTVSEEIQKSLREHIYSDVSNLIICKISLRHSQSKIEKLLARYIMSESHLLLLIANMQEISKKMINHLRIMIEEAENKIRNQNKVFVLLLHFPPVMFFKPCYPSLFLMGWGHYYLDTIACCTLTREGVKSVVDVKEWFHHCCFPQSPRDSIDNQMVIALEQLLPEAIPIIASRVALTCKDERNMMNASERTSILQRLLIGTKSDLHGNGQSGGLGKMLCIKYCKYWTPQQMVQQIKRVSNFMYERESTLNITDSIQSVVRSTFFDFLVYMFSNLNERNDIHILVEEPECSPPVQQLFLDLLVALPAPELSQIKVLTTAIRQQVFLPYFPRFPFFKQVCDTLDKAIDESREEVNQKLNILDTAKPHPESSLHLLTQKRTKQQMEKLYIQVVTSRVKKMKGCLEVTASAMNEYGDKIWNRYFDDFAHDKLHLKPEVSPLTKQILRAYIGPVTGSDALVRLVSLHVRLHVYQMDLPKVTTILKPISKMQPEMNPVATGSLANLLSVASSMHDFKSFVRIPQTLVSLIVETLFTFASHMSTAESESESLKSWYQSYSDIMSMPSMEENIILSTASVQTQTQLRVLHATYLVMQCCYDSESRRGQQVFRTLHSKYFRQSTKIGGPLLYLQEMVTAGLRALTATPLSPSIQGRESYCVQSFIEGLFSFTFSKHCVSFAEEDCLYFLEVANQQYNFCYQVTTQESAVAVGEDPHLYNCTAMNVFKLYLSRILDEAIQEPKKQEAVDKGRSLSQSNPLMLHNPKGRGIVGKVLTAKLKGTPGPYIPVFYQHRGIQCGEISSKGCKNALMQQPLAHLYFLTVLEHLQSRGNRPNHLVRLTGKITGLLERDCTPKAEKVLLFIEKQTVVQVLIQQVAAHFDPKNPLKVQDLFNARLMNGVNPLLSDNSMGGSSTCVGWHGLVFAMQIQKRLNSQQKLIERLTDDQGTLVAISGVKPLQALIKSQPKNEAHLFPFIDPEKSSVLGRFYQQIWETLNNVLSKKANQESVATLVKLAQESCNSDEKMKFTDTSSLLISKRNAFRMLLWLCVYYKFFVTKIHSQVLADAINNSLRGVLEPEFISFIQSFLYPVEYMIQNAESPPPLNENAPRLQWTEGYQFVPLQGEGERTDPIFELFNSVHKLKPDPSDVELCHAMANMVAVVLACPPRSNHLWYHMFAADGLFGSHMTGFMYNGKITEGRLYDCGVELASDGTYGRPDYLQHATRGTLSLHSLYLILWANFGAFCMALVTQADAQEKISGPIISTWQSIRHYCVMQLRSMWLHMGNNLQLSLDEQSFFVMQCMKNLLEISVRQPHLLKSGKFETPEALDDYEKMWHHLIFTPSYTNVHEKFAEYCKLMKNPLFRDLSCLEVHYPHFPMMDEISQTILSSVDIGDAKNKLYVLSKFVLEYPRLQAAGALLPDLLEFYQWIHTELAYLVTRKYAETESIEAVITTAEQKYAGIDLNKLYERVKDGYNKYAQVIGYSIGAGACANNKREGALLQIQEDTKLMHFLSTDAKDQWEGSDLLRVVIEDIIIFHNSFLQTVFTVGSTSEHHNWKFEQSEHEMDFIHPTEVNEDVMIIGKTLKSHGIDEHLHLVRSRHLQPIQTGVCPFDLERLQSDVIKTYLAGKPLIHQLPDHGHDQILFKFKNEPTDELVLEGADLDLSMISGYIEDDFKLPLDEQMVKALEYEFYTADYHTLVKVVTGLKVATEYLIKCLQLPDEVEFDSTDELKQKTLPEFLLLVFKVPEEKEENMMLNIGIKVLPRSQLEYLLSLKLPFLYSTLEQFVQWVKDGMFDFHQLPLVMRKHLEPPDEEALSNIQNTYAGTSGLLQEMQTLTGVLVHSESDIRKNISILMQKPIMEYLGEYGLYGDEGEQLTRMIPSSVLCQHYVALRIFLRRKIAEVQNEISARSRKQVESQAGRWVEFILDLWNENRLKHLWDVAIPYVNDHLFEFDPATQLYGFQTLHIEAEIEAEKPLLFILTEDDKEEEEEERDQPLLPAETTAEPQEGTQQPTTVQQTEEAPKIPSNNTELLELAENITTEMVTELMHKWKLDKYKEIFSDNDIDGYLLFTSSEKDLKDLGITSGIDQRKILRNFKKYVTELAKK